MAKNVFVLGSDPFNWRTLENIEVSSDLRFHDLVPLDTVLEHHADTGRVLEMARRRMDEFEAPIHGIVAYWDFPVQMMAAILRSELGLPTPTLEATLKCEHKYWSRKEQQRIAPELIPEFQVFDPLDEAVHEKVTLESPFWIKPIKGTNSELAFAIREEEDFEEAIDRIRRGIYRIAVPFDQLLVHADLPSGISDVTGRYCVAEGTLAGEQFTTSGYVWEGRAHVYGIVDSLNYPGTSSFSRYQYPSRLPERTQRRLADAAEKVMEGFGFDHGPFNVEFFLDMDADRLSLLEINPRISQSHGDIYRAVDGEPNHKIMADLAVGRRPQPPQGRGTSPVASKFYVRHFQDGTVVRTPGEDDIVRIERRFPEARIDVRVRAGDRLSELTKQDSYSFELAHIYLGGETEEDLLSQYEQCVAELAIRVED